MGGNKIRQPVFNLIALHNQTLEPNSFRMGYSDTFQLEKDTKDILIYQINDRLWQINLNFYLRK